MSMENSNNSPKQIHEDILSTNKEDQSKEEQPPVTIKEGSVDNKTDEDTIKIKRSELKVLIDGNNNFMNMVFLSLDSFDQMQVEVSNLNAKVLNMKEDFKRMVKGEQPRNQNQNQKQPQK